MPEVKINITEKKKKMLICISIIFIWVLLSGIGGFSWQNRWDHMFRNAIFNDLFTYNWPVINTEGNSPLLLCYYIGFWLPSALIGKLFNSISAGYVFQFIYGFIGVALSFFLICEWLKKISYKALIILIFFSGLDIIAFILLRTDLIESFEKLLNFEHIELQIYLFNSSSNTTLLFWLYNQIIPFWITFMLILLQKNNKYIFFTYSLLILYAPFPALALIPAIILLEFKRSHTKWNNKAKLLSKFCKDFVTIPNFLGLFITVIISLYYKSNIAVGSIHLVPITVKNISLFILYLLIEYTVYILFFFNKIKKDYLFHSIFITMIFLSFVQLGDGYDFAWRTAIPASFYLALIVMNGIEYKRDSKKIKNGLLILVLVVGAFTPILEISRTIKYTIGYKVYNDPFLSPGLTSVFLNDIGYYGNFIGQEESLFGKYIMK